MDEHPLRNISKLVRPNPERARKEEARDQERTGTPRAPGPRRHAGDRTRDGGSRKDRSVHSDGRVGGCMLGGWELGVLGDVGGEVPETTDLRRKARKARSYNFLSQCEKRVSYDNGNYNM